MIDTYCVYYQLSNYDQEKMLDMDLMLLVVIKKTRTKIKGN